MNLDEINNLLNTAYGIVDIKKFDTYSGKDPAILDEDFSNDIENLAGLVTISLDTIKSLQMLEKFKGAAEELERNRKLYKQCLPHSFHKTKSSIDKYKNIFKKGLERSLRSYGNAEYQIEAFVDRLEKNGFIYPSDHKSAKNFFLDGRPPQNPIKFRKNAAIFYSFRNMLTQRIGASLDYREDLKILFGLEIFKTSTGGEYKQGTKSKQKLETIRVILDSLKDNSPKI